MSKQTTFFDFKNKQEFNPLQFITTVLVSPHCPEVINSLPIKEEDIDSVKTVMRNNKVHFKIETWHLPSMQITWNEELQGWMSPIGKSRKYYFRIISENTLLITSLV